MELKRKPEANAGLLFQCPISEVFDAFVNPYVINKFWFDRSSGALEPGAEVQWHFDALKVVMNVVVKDVRPNERILIGWSAGKENSTSVEWLFEERTPDSTYVRVINSGFSGDADKAVDAALDATGGFAMVLVAAKAWLEHGINLNVVRDRY